MSGPAPAPLALLSPDVVARTEELRARFAAAQPFPHVVIDDFLAPAAAQALRAEFPAFEQGNYIGDDGRPGGKSTFDRVKRLGPTFRALDAAIQSREFLAWLGRTTSIPDLLYDPFYLGGGTHENRHGQSLDAHIDFNYHPSERWHRRLNLIVYLNPEWDAAWGGALELFRDPHVDGRPDVSVVPAWNRCVIFETSERSWHGFAPLHLPADKRELTRRSVALYFYTADRPAAETAPRHTTHYVPRPLPERFAPGRVLDAADVAELHELLARRDGQIRGQYEEIARLLQAQDQGLTGQLMYLAKRLYVRLRR